MVSEHFNRVLSPLVVSHPSHIYDTNNALRLFKSYSFPSGPSQVLFALDIKSFYTVIAHNEGLLVFKHYLGFRPDFQPDNSTLLRLAEFVLSFNRFSFARVVLPTSLTSGHGKREEPHPRLVENGP